MFLRVSWFALRCALAALIIGASLAVAQQGMNMAMPTAASLALTSSPFRAYLLQHATSGTGAEPESTPTPMLMASWRGWTLMLHGEGFLTLQQQSGPRGADKLFSTNWAMAMAQHPLGPGRLTLRTMLSLEPATITARRYPELFQTGETTFGRPIVDGQHPHNFFMELAALYDLPLGRSGLLSLYVAPMGDPAIGPVAFPHRASAGFDPIAPLGHHLEDSTHIAADVITLGLTYGDFRLESSAFHGREPDENRWAIQYGALDSYSWRATLSPAKDWSGQFSWAHLHSLEALTPQEDQIRMTASVMYNRPLRAGNWANTLLWGRTRNVGGGNVLNGYLLESNLGFLHHYHAWTRIENRDQTNELLLGQNPEPPGFTERFLARIQAYSFGFARDLPALHWLTPSLGAQWTYYGIPRSLRATYGNHPQALALFLHLTLGKHRGNVI